MHVEFTKPTLVGTRCHVKGDVIEVDTIIGARLVNSGSAVKCVEPPAPPQADKPQAGDDQPQPKRTRRGK